MRGERGGGETRITYSHQTNDHGPVNKSVPVGGGGTLELHKDGESGELAGEGKGTNAKGPENARAPVESHGSGRHTHSPFTEKKASRMST